MQRQNPLKSAGLAVLGAVPAIPPGRCDVKRWLGQLSSPLLKLLINPGWDAA
jgi:hypothetical protein